MLLTSYIQQQIIEPKEIQPPGNPEFENEAKSGWANQKEAANAHYLAYFADGITAKELAVATGRSVCATLTWLSKNAQSDQTGSKSSQYKWSMAR